MCKINLSGPYRFFKSAAFIPGPIAVSSFFWALLKTSGCQSAFSQRKRIPMATWRVGETKRQREETVFTEPSCSPQAGTREVIQRLSEMPLEAETKEGEMPDASLLSPWTQGLGQAAIDKSTQRPHSQTAWEWRLQGSTARCKAEQQKGKNGSQSEQAMTRTHWDSFLALEARSFPLTQLKSFLFLWGLTLLKLKSKKRHCSEFLLNQWRGEAAWPNGGIPRARETSKKPQTHGQ